MDLFDAAETELGLAKMFRRFITNRYGVKNSKSRSLGAEAPRDDKK